MINDDFTPLFNKSSNIEQLANMNSDEIYLNIYSQRTFRDKLFSLLFLVNLIITVIICSIMLSKKNEIDNQQKSEITSMNIIPLILAFSIELLIIIWTIFFSESFILHSYFVSTVIILASIILIIIGKKCYYSLFELVLIILMIGLFLNQVGFRKSTISVSETVSTIQLKYPKFFLFLFGMFLPIFLFSLLYDNVTYKIYINNWNKWFHLYLFLSFLWINATVSYICNYVSSGFTVLYFFYGNSMQIPRTPIILLLKYSLTYSFGTLAYSALISPYLWLDKFIPFKKLTRAIRKYDASLIYCSAYGIDFNEANRRVAFFQNKLSISTIISNSSLYSSGLMLSFAMSILVGSISVFISKEFISHDKVITITMLFTMFISFCINGCFISSFNGMANALYILYCSASSTMKKIFPILYSDLLLVCPLSQCV